MLGLPLKIPGPRLGLPNVRLQTSSGISPKIDESLAYLCFAGRIHTVPIDWNCLMQK